VTLRTEDVTSQPRLRAFARAASTPVSAAHRWSGTSRPRWFCASRWRPFCGRDLADEPWVLTPRAAWPPWHRQYDEDFAHAGYRPRVVERGTTPQNLLALVAAGMGVTRLPLSARTLRDSGVAFVPLSGDLVDVVLVWRPDARNPALPALREVVREVGRTTDLTAAG
jgi:DNA-binding transcriptional LysR family regulator